MLPNNVKGTFSDFMYYKMKELQEIQGKVENKFKYEATIKDLKAEGPMTVLLKDCLLYTSPSPRDS
mgnify:CR=1 FL=1